jgi:hypothetical protein
MYDSKHIDAQHLKMLELLLMDPIIASAVRLDGVRSDKVIVQEDGSLRFQKSKYGWICKLFDYYKDMSFVDVTVRIASAITSNGTNCDDDSLVGIIKETVDKVLKENRKDEVIELLLAYTMFFNENSILRLRYKQDSPQPTKSGKGVDLDGHGWMRCRVDLGSESFPAIVEFKTRK